MREPAARRMNSGEAPTALKARTGLSTPPGRMRSAREKRRDDCVVFMAEGSRLMANGPSNICHEPSALDSDRSSARLDRRKVPDGGGEEFLFVLIARDD